MYLATPKEKQHSQGKCQYKDLTIMLSFRLLSKASVNINWALAKLVLQLKQKVRNFLTFYFS
jgi:hypothetical protein